MHPQAPEVLFDGARLRIEDVAALSRRERTATLSMGTVAARDCLRALDRELQALIAAIRAQGWSLYR